MIEIKDKGACCGCEACVQRCPKHCIAFVKDEEGFRYPEVDKSSCIGCGLCETVCPVAHQGAVREPVEVYAAIHNDESVRMQSSSGGLFTALAEQVIDDGGVVFGARFNDAWEVVHGYTETVEGLASFRGSKYVQSRIGDAFSQAESFLKAGRRVMFTGTPCQISGLKLFLRKEYPLLLAVDIICHGVPSPLVWRSYLEEKKLLRPLDGNGKKTVFPSLNDVPVVTGIAFRDKHDGWKKYGFAVRGHSAACRNTVSPSKVEESLLLRERYTDNVFMRGFLADLYLRPSCHACPAKELKSGSDITLGDFWGIQSLRPDIDDDKGICALLVNTSKGAGWVRRLDIKKYAFRYEDVVRGNPALIRSACIPEKRSEFYAKLKYRRMIGLIREYTRKPLVLRMKIWGYNLLSKYCKR